jgi:hypothetical protein
MKLSALLRVSSFSQKQQRGRPRACTDGIHSIDGGGKQSLLRLADLDVHAFLGDLAGHPRNVNLSDRLGPLVIQISQDAQSHERNRQKETEQSIIVHGSQSSHSPILAPNARHARAFTEPIFMGLARAWRAANDKARELGWIV